jgi:hypothetical protein
MLFSERLSTAERRTVVLLGDAVTTVTIGVGADAEPLM